MTFITKHGKHIPIGDHGVRRPPKRRRYTPSEGARRVVSGESPESVEANMTQSDIRSMWVMLKHLPRGSNSDKFSNEMTRITGITPARNMMM